MKRITTEIRRGLDIPVTRATLERSMEELLNMKEAISSDPASRDASGWLIPKARKKLDAIDHAQLGREASTNRKPRAVRRV